jgi:3-keto-5-aminohexanoate cleavage enzyme
MFSEAFAVGFPPKPYALVARLALLEEEAGRAPWMIAGLCADIRPLIGEAVTKGGHVRVGLEDAPLGTPMSNLALVEEAVRIVRHYGAEPASSADMRHALGSITDGI